jgi:Putative rhamnosyl transferase
MVQQTSKRFIWIIRTDPELDDELLHDMSQLLQPYPHFFLVRSNNNDDPVANLSVASVVTGDINLLQQVARNQNTAIRIETRLDADDGLNLDFVQYLQNQTLPTNQTLVYCVGPHLEWISHSNQLKPAHAPHCITPGLTVITSPNGKVLPKIPHHKVASLVPPCPRHTHDKKVRPFCLMRLDSMNRPAAIRARTPTSAGMANVFSRDDSNAALEIWQFLVKDFGINLSDVEEVRHYLQTQQHDIAMENLMGQWYVLRCVKECNTCSIADHFVSSTKGHSCKASSKETLRNIINFTH